MIRLLATSLIFAAADDNNPPANSGTAAKETAAKETAAKETVAKETAAKETAAKEPVAKEPVAKEPAPRDPLIKTVSEVAALSPKKQNAFRAAGGTTIEDPV